MSQLRKRTIYITLVFAAVVLVLGGGAFSAVSVDRSATIAASGDDSALLSIEKHPNADSNLFGTGATFSFEVSPGATTTYAEFLLITNRGSQPVSIWIVDHDVTGSTDTGDLPGDIIGGKDENNTAHVTFFNTTFGGAASCENGKPSIEGVGNAVEVDAGSSLAIGLQANTSDVASDEADLLDSMTVNADASVSGVSSELNTVC